MISKGDYIWILGAQDTLNPGSFIKIINILQENPWQVVLNSAIYDEKSNSVIHESLIKISTNFKDSDYYNFYQKLGGPCLSISAYISKSSSLKSANFKTGTKYWSWLERILNSAINSDSMRNFQFISSPCITIMIETDGWQNIGNDITGMKLVQNSHPIYFTFLELTELGGSRFGRVHKMKYLLGAFRDPFGIPSSIASAKTAGLNFNYQVQRRTFRTFKVFAWYWVLGLPLSFLPQNFFTQNKLINFQKFVHLIRKSFGIQAK